MKEFWSYLYGDGSVHELGAYDIETEWDELFSKAQAIGEAEDTEPVFAIHELDLSEIPAQLQNIYNRTNGARGAPLLSIDALIDCDELAFLYKLARQHPKVEFLQYMRYQATRARKIWKEGAQK